MPNSMVSDWLASAPVDQRQILEGDGKAMRHVKITSHNELDTTALKAMLTQAYVGTA